MSATSDQEMLDEINAAILALVRGRVAGYSINNRSLTKLSLKELQAMKTEYEARVARTATGGFYAGQLRDPE